MQQRDATTHGENRKPQQSLRGTKSKVAWLLVMISDAAVCTAHSVRHCHRPNATTYLRLATSLLVSGIIYMMSYYAHNKVADTGKRRPSHQQ
jgi:hypothetical protein